MTTSEPKPSRPNPLAEGPTTTEGSQHGRGLRPWLAGVYRLDAARTLLKLLSGKDLLDTVESERPREVGDTTER